jgi:hypothetical protein
MNRMISINEFDEEYFHKCWKLANCICQLDEYFHGKENSRKIPDIFKFCKAFWDNPDSFCRWNTEYCAWNWKYTDENGHEYTEDEMLELLNNFYTS